MKNKPIRAYKFRTLHNFENILDIFYNKRFYAAHYKDLNDPMEGTFKYEDDVEKKDIEHIERNKEHYRICSFSKSFDNILLWAHYADSFKGICIEVELRKNIEYLTDVSYGIFTIANDLAKYPGKLSDIAFTTKNKAWKYEKEIRFITKNEYIYEPDVNIKSVLLGIRTSETIKRILLQILQPNIEIWETAICNKSNKVKKTKIRGRISKSYSDLPN